ncbi:winged helix-turn-helix transcriptional regulator [Bacteroides propionicifaciens]|jgi:DNA-binding HxlR family transcriptional regulator|uniref:winged helix-turn-helix transcriptional regulator n=1 Tax=Bacteroides propionicifaciens TaxID=392838 RepID=UPI0003607179|nr:helix-turn-helix domain-containing protein [Bacteroides propionicifaciens]
MDAKPRAIQNKVCPLEFAVNAISGKWKIPIIWQMNQGNKRPSEFLRELTNLDRRVLNQQLKEMEKDGLITRKSFNEVPPRVEYTLTDRGDSLVKVLWGLNEWGKELLGME